jgi:protein O-mannosyl-transferase
MLAVLAYGPALRAGFIWDDDAMLTGNPFVKLPAGLFYIWASTELPDYFPLASTSFWLEWRLWGDNPMGYHLTNVLLHAASAVLLWKVLAALRIPGAWLAAVVFALHPVNVQSVAWIAERKNTLCMFFFLLSVLWYLRFDAAQSNNADHKSRIESRKWYWFSLLAFLAALLSKTAVVMLPVVLLLYHWWRATNSCFNASTLLPFNGTPPRALGVSPVQLAARLGPFFALSLVLGLVTIWFQTHRAIAGDPIRSADFLTRLAGAARAVWFYLEKMFVPVKLTFVYPQWEVDAGSMISWLPSLGLVCAFGLFWFFRRSWGRHGLFALGYFTLMLLPILGFVDVYFHRYSPVADHWAYFAGIGIIAFVVGSGAHLFTRYRNQVGARLLPAAAVAVVMAMGIGTWRQAGIYREPGTLWQDTLAKNPACWLAHNSLGTLYANAGHMETARAHYHQALAIKPDAVEALNNVASVLLDEGKVDEAIVHLRKALEVAPRSAMAHYNLGNAHDEQGQPDQAEKFYRRALELDPGLAEAHSNLGCLLYAAGRKQEAMDEFIRAIALKPDYADALNNLGALFLEQGSMAQAESLLLEAVRHQPAHHDAWFNRGNALLRQGRVAEAAFAYRRVLALTPQHALAHCRLATALWHAGNSKAALQELGSALNLQPDLAEAHHQTGVILAVENEPATALVHLRRAIELQPDWPEALADLAFTLATVSSDNHRNGGEALSLAARAVAQTGGTNFTALDALAATQAEAANFAEAIQTARAAAELARTAGDTNRAAQIELRQKQYESGQPHRR